MLSSTMRSLLIVAASHIMVYFGQPILSHLTTYVTGSVGSALDHYHNVEYNIFENRCDKTLWLQFGTALDGRFGFAERLKIEPNNAVYERIQTEFSAASAERKCALLSKGDSDSSDVEKMLIIVNHPKEPCLSKVFAIYKDKVTVNCNPQNRHWHLGDVKAWQ